MITQSSSEQNICFLVRTADTPAVLTAVEREFELEIVHEDVDHVGSQDNVSIIAVVGAGMRGHPGIAARVFGAMDKSQISILSMAQGSSEYNLSLVVSNGDVDVGVRAIHEQFHLDRS
jgi:aspartokinase/homoserine dehydrogenase 1